MLDGYSNSVDLSALPPQIPCKEPMSSTERINLPQPRGGRHHVVTTNKMPRADVKYFARWLEEIISRGQSLFHSSDFEASPVSLMLSPFYLGRRYPQRLATSPLAFCKYHLSHCFLMMATNAASREIGRLTHMNPVTVIISLGGSS